MIDFMRGMGNSFEVSLSEKKFNIKNLHPRSFCGTWSPSEGAIVAGSGEELIDGFTVVFFEDVVPWDCNSLVASHNGVKLSFHIQPRTMGVYLVRVSVFCGNEMVRYQFNEKRGNRTTSKGTRSVFDTVKKYATRCSYFMRYVDPVDYNDFYKGFKSSLESMGYIWEVELE
jgi:hypothetical protein